MRPDGPPPTSSRDLALRERTRDVSGRDQDSVGWAIGETNGAEGDSMPIKVVDIDVEGSVAA